MRRESYMERLVRIFQEEGYAPTSIFTIAPEEMVEIPGITVPNIRAVLCLQSKIMEAIMNAPQEDIRWTKRCKDPALVGTVKETVKQVSHSKKWGYEKIPDEHGKVQRVNTYSLLQDRFHEHMKAAGYMDFERGERGSTAEHLSVLDYKIDQESQRLGFLDDEVMGKKKLAAALENKVEKLEDRLAVAKKSNATWDSIQGMPKKNLMGRIEVSPADWQRVLDLAKESLSSRSTLAKMKEQLLSSRKDRDIYKTRWESLFARTQDYLDAEKHNPEETRRALEAVRASRPAKEKTTPPRRKNSQER